MLFQQRFGFLQIKFLRLSLVHAAVEAAEQRVVDGVAVHVRAEANHLAGREAAKLGADGLGVGADRGIESAGGYIAESQAKAPARAVDAAHIVIFALVEHTALRHGAGGDNAGDIPLHKTLCSGGILHLLANGHLVALLHQTGDVGIHAVEGNAAHGGLLLLGLTPIPGGEGEIQLPGSQFGILVEHLIEVAQTEKQDAVLIALLDGVILPLHGGHFVCRFCHSFGSFIS